MVHTNRRGASQWHRSTSHYFPLTAALRPFFLISPITTTTSQRERDRENRTQIYTLALKMCLSRWQILAWEKVRQFVVNHLLKWLIVFPLFCFHEWMNECRCWNSFRCVKSVYARKSCNNSCYCCCICKFIRYFESIFHIPTDLFEFVIFLHLFTCSK